MTSFALIGQNIGHSLSKEIHETLYAYPYRLCDIDDVDAFMADVPFDGLNVTHPYKHAVLRHCTARDDHVKITQAANALVKTAGGWMAHNTDFVALKHILKHRLTTDDRIALVGGGATAKTIAAALDALGIVHVQTYARHPEYDQHHLNKINDFPHHTVLINATPVGMDPDYDGTLPLDFNQLSGLRMVFDVVYSPFRTNLILTAKRHEISALNGLSLLFIQALASAKHFHGAPPSVNPSDVFNALFLTNANIVLIGLPLSGKSTVGNALAKTMNKPFYDTDVLLEEKFGKEIFKWPGTETEYRFRECEADVMRECASRKGSVIACGGGAPLSTSAMAALERTGVIVWLDREATHFDDGALAKRPILKNRDSLAQLHRARRKQYQAAADITVVPGKDVRKTIAEIGVKIDAYIGSQRAELESFGNA